MIRLLTRHTHFSDAACRICYCHIEPVVLTLNETCQPVDAQTLSLTSGSIFRDEMTMFVVGADSCVRNKCCIVIAHGA